MLFVKHSLFRLRKEKDKIKLRLEGVDIDDLGNAIIISTI